MEPVWRRLSSSGEARVSLFGSLRSTLICDSRKAAEVQKLETMLFGGQEEEPCFGVYLK